MTNAWSPPARGLPGTLFAGLLAVVAGLAIAWVDLRSDEVIVAVVPLLVVGALLGLARPAYAWAWGLLLGMWIPVAHWTGFLGTPATDSGPPWAMVLPLIPPTIGACVGAAIELVGGPATTATHPTHPVQEKT